MNVFKTFHPIVTSLLLGTIMVRAASFMALPFLAIYLSKTTDFNPVIIGLVIGIGPLTSTFGSFIGGTLSDIVGRKALMFSALIMYAFVFFGFATAHHPWIFLVLNAINGLCRWQLERFVFVFRLNDHLRPFVLKRFPNLPCVYPLLYH